MKKTILLTALFLAAAILFSVMAVFAEDRPKPQGNASGTALPASDSVPGQAAVPPESPAVSPAVTPAVALEPIFIGLGLLTVILIAIFKWGVSAHPKKQEK